MSNELEILEGKVIRAVYPRWGDSRAEDKKDRMDSTIEGDVHVFVGDYDDDGGETIIEFTDGTYITIWASEWGGIMYRIGGCK